MWKFSLKRAGSLFVCMQRADARRLCRPAELGRMNGTATGRRSAGYSRHYQGDWGLVRLPLFLLGGKMYDISREDVERQALILKPGMLLPRKFSVRIAGKAFPVKQPIIAAAGIEAGAFTSMEACKVLSWLGYEVEYNR